MILQILIAVMRGILYMSPAIVFGILVARYVPPRMIGYGTLVLLVVVLYMAGEVFYKPGKRWRM